MKVKEALERSCNSINEAISILCLRKDHKKFRLPEIECSEELHIYQWLHKKAQRGMMVRMGIEGKEGAREV